MARREMVGELAATGASERALAAIGAVRREDFVPTFFAFPPDQRFGSPEDMREWTTTGIEVDDQTVRLVYDRQRALGIARSPEGRTTSTVSAPVLLVAMLDLLELAPGMSVLELGAGSGYTAALIAEMVGPAGRVVSVDIDESLIATAQANLERSGHADRVTILAGDGDDGAPSHGPFDRIVATVGCVDLSPAWFDQLTGDGFALIPVQHGGVHPLHRAARDEAGVVSSRTVGRSAFVGIQGQQTSARSPWPWAGRPGPREGLSTRPLAPDLVEALADDPSRALLGSRRLWDFDFYLSLVDRRAAYLGILVGPGGSTAAIDLASGDLAHAGPDGEAVAADLEDHARRWLALGKPEMAGFRSQWMPIASGVSDDPASPGPESATPNRWTVSRAHHQQVVTLDR